MTTSKLGRVVKGAFAVAVLAAIPGNQPVAAQTAGQTAQGQSLPLSMAQAVSMALDANLDLKAERLSVDIASHGVALARSAFLPQVSGGTSRSSSKSVPSDFTQGSSDITSTNLGVQGTVRQSLPWYGGDYSVTWSGSRGTSDYELSPFNPRLGSRLRFDFTQPLLRDFKRDSARVGLESAERRRAITDLQVQRQVYATEAAVKLAYLTLVAAIEGKKVAEQNLDIVQQSLNQSKSRVAVGQSPEIEIVQAEAQVASTREGVIRATAFIESAEDNLRTLILDPSRSDFWQIHLVPTDQIQLAPRTVNLDEAIKTALANRLDLQVENRNLDIANLNLELSRNNTKTALDINASYSAEGTAGTQFEFGQGFPPPVVSQTRRSFGSALGDTFGGAYPTWSLGVSVTYPIGTTAARAAYAQAQIQRQQQEIGIRQLEVIIVAQVRDAVRQVQNTFERVQAAQAAREASQRQLTAEERRNSVGLSTTLDLQIRQRDLASARTVELQAMIDYNRALIQLERVQRIQ